MSRPWGFEAVASFFEKKATTGTEHVMFESPLLRRERSEQGDEDMPGACLWEIRKPQLCRYATSRAGEEVLNEQGEFRNLTPNPSLAVSILY